MSILVCGSMAYDNIMVFEDYFKNHILPDQIHLLNVSFTVPQMQRYFGGCAGNIAYNLHLLDAKPQIMATVGDDAVPYLEYFKKLGISTKLVRQIPQTYTAQAFITTDLDNNQITAFHPGAMLFSHKSSIKEAKGVELAIVSPDGRDGMIKHASDLAAAGIPFIFDLGQALPIFSGDELLNFMNLATYACFNDYEIKTTCQRTGRTIKELSQIVEALVVTHGGEGSHIYTKDHSFAIPSAPVNAVVDPTGCGDAYRAGFMYGIVNGWDWEKTGRLASLMGAFKVEEKGCQTHTPNREDIASRYKKAFNTSLWTSE